MKHFYLTLLTILLAINVSSQTDEKILDLEYQKKKFELKIKHFTDSINEIDLKIAKLRSKDLLDKIKDSSLTSIARKGAKLKKGASLYADLITVFAEDKEVIILNYKEGYFEVCQGSLCGYMHEMWVEKNNSTSEFTKPKVSERKAYSSGSRNVSSFSSTSKSSKPANSSRSTSSKSSYSSTRYRSSKSYYRGPRGGCYYINSNGNKSYVARSLCN